MKRIAWIVPFILLISISNLYYAYGAWVWTPETGQWFNPKHAVKDTSKEQFDWALSFYKAKDYKKAISEFRKLVKFYPNSKDAPQAQYYVGRCYEEMEEYYHAFLVYQSVIETYPYAKNREDIIERQYKIGLLFLKGQKAKILGIAVLPATDKAVEILEQVVKNSPYGKYADKAQFKIGEAYKRGSRFAEATLAFQKVVDEYPNSNLAEKADYQIAQCTYLASLDAYYSQEPTDTAIEKFEDFVREAGDGSLSEEARMSIEKLKERKAQNLYETARFYEKIGRRGSAAIYYKEVIEKYPHTALASQAMAKIMEIERGKP